MNLALKIAILRDGRPEWAIASAAGLGPVRLSQLVRAHAHARTDEANSLAAVLGVDVGEIFPAVTEMARSA